MTPPSQQDSTQAHSNRSSLSLSNETATGLRSSRLSGISDKTSRKAAARTGYRRAARTQRWDHAARCIHQFERIALLCRILKDEPALTPSSPNPSTNEFCQAKMMRHAEAWDAIKRRVEVCSAGCAICNRRQRRGVSANWRFADRGRISRTS